MVLPSSFSSLKNDFPLAFLGFRNVENEMCKRSETFYAKQRWGVADAPIAN